MVRQRDFSNTARRYIPVNGGGTPTPPDAPRVQRASSSWGMVTAEMIFRGGRDLKRQTGCHGFPKFLRRPDGWGTERSRGSSPANGIRLQLCRGHRPANVLLNGFCWPPLDARGSPGGENCSQGVELRVGGPLEHCTGAKADDWVHRKSQPLRGGRGNKRLTQAQAALPGERRPWSQAHQALSGGKVAAARSARGRVPGCRQGRRGTGLPHPGGCHERSTRGCMVGTPQFTGEENFFEDRLRRVARSGSPTFFAMGTSGETHCAITLR